MSYRSKRTKENGAQAVQANISTADGLSKPIAKKPRCVPSNLDPITRPAAKGVASVMSKDKVPLRKSPMGEGYQPTTARAQKFTFPPHLDPAYVRLTQKSKSVIPGKQTTEKISLPTEVPPVSTQPSRPIEAPQISTQPTHVEPSWSVHASEEQGRDNDTRTDLAEYDESEGEPMEQENVQDNVRKSKSSKARCMKSRSVAANSPNNLNIDEDEEVLTIDAEKKYKILSGAIQPRDIDNLEDGVSCIVSFNEFNQPLKKGGSVLVKYLGSLAKNGTFCPIGAESWHHVNDIYKADIVRRVREKFVIPQGEIFDDVILSRVSKFWRHYKSSLKTLRFHPEKKTKEQIINNVPPGHTKDNWMRLVEFWYSGKSQELSNIGKEARASQSHVHTTGSTSYANKRVEFVECNGKQPSNLEFFEFTHTKIGGGFVENILSSQLLEEANSKVDELVLASSPSKSRTEIENDVFHNLMYETDKPKRPVGFGFGVKQSQVFGVHSILRQRIWISYYN